MIWIHSVILPGVMNNENPVHNCLFSWFCGFAFYRASLRQGWAFACFSFMIVDLLVSCSMRSLPQYSYLRVIACMTPSPLFLRIDEMGKMSFIAQLGTNTRCLVAGNHLNFFPFQLWTTFCPLHVIVSCLFVGPSKLKRFFFTGGLGAE